MRRGLRDGRQLAILADRHDRQRTARIRVYGVVGHEQEAPIRLRFRCVGSSPLLSIWLINDTAWVFGSMEKLLTLPTTSVWPGPFSLTANRWRWSVERVSQEGFRFDHLTWLRFELAGLGVEAITINAFAGASGVGTHQYVIVGHGFSLNGNGGEAAGYHQPRQESWGHWGILF